MICAKPNAEKIMVITKKFDIENPASEMIETLEAATSATWLHCEGGVLRAMPD